MGDAIYLSPRNSLVTAGTVTTYKLLCFSMIGRPENAAVNSANANRALKRSMKNKTPRISLAEAEDALPGKEFLTSTGK